MLSENYCPLVALNTPNSYPFEELGKSHPKLVSSRKIVPFEFELLNYFFPSVTKSFIQVLFLNLPLVESFAIRTFKQIS